MNARQQRNSKMGGCLVVADEAKRLAREKRLSFLHTIYVFTLIVSRNKPERVFYKDLAHYGVRSIPARERGVSSPVNLDRPV